MKNGPVHLKIAPLVAAASLAIAGCKPEASHEGSSSTKPDTSPLATLKMPSASKGTEVYEQNRKDVEGIVSFAIKQGSITEAQGAAIIEKLKKATNTAELFNSTIALLPPGTFDAYQADMAGGMVKKATEANIPALVQEQISGNVKRALADPGAPLATLVVNPNAALEGEYMLQTAVVGEALELSVKRGKLTEARAREIGLELGKASNAADLLSKARELLPKGAYDAALGVGSF